MSRTFWRCACSCDNSESHRSLTCSTRVSVHYTVSIIWVPPLMSVSRYIIWPRNTSMWIYATYGYCGGILSSTRMDTLRSNVSYMGPPVEQRGPPSDPLYPSPEPVSMVRTPWSCGNIHLDRTTTRDGRLCSSTCSIQTNRDISCPLLHRCPTCHLYVSYNIQHPHIHPMSRHVLLIHVIFDNGS